MEKLSKKEVKLAQKRQYKKQHSYKTLLNAFKITEPSQLFSVKATDTVCIVNLGYSGLGSITYQQLHQILSEFDGFEKLVMASSLPFSFASFKVEESASNFRDKVNDKPLKSFKDKYVYVEFIERSKVPEFSYQPKQIPGMTYLDNFLTQSEHDQLVQQIEGYEGWSCVASRFVKHFGFEFDYEQCHAGTEVSNPFPNFCNWLLERFYSLPQFRDVPKFDQLTISKYPPGTGIPPHCDSHTAFLDTILSVSLQSKVLMEFKQFGTSNNEEHHAEIDKNALVKQVLESGSLVVFQGEVRYCWQHAIKLRASDLLPTGELIERKPRISLTFRTIRRDLGCTCTCYQLCDRNRVVAGKLLPRK